jgi:hypothetical protein
MEKKLISDFEIEIDNVGEILNMGGPWVGTLLIQGEKISDNCIIDNFVFNKPLGLLFFIKFHVITDYNFYFTINFYNIRSKTGFEFNKEFNMIFIKQFVGPSEIEIYNAFHDQFPDKKDIFNIDNEAFKPM